METLLVKIKMTAVHNEFTKISKTKFIAIFFILPIRLIQHYNREVKYIQNG